MNRDSWVGNLWRAALVILVLGNDAYAGATPDNQTMQFSYTTNGAVGGINRYGNNAISVLGDLLRVEIGDSDGNMNMSGVGIYEMKLSGENLEAARQMAELLCSPKDPKSDVTLPNLYIVKCGGERRSSYIRDLSRPVVIKIEDLVEKLTDAAVLDGHKLVKLDVSLASIDRTSDGFVVSIKFINGGDYPIKFKTPDRWDSRIGKDSLGVSDSKSGMSVKFGLGLAGQPFVDSEQFPVGEVNLAPHSTVVLKIKAGRVKKFSAGTYDLYAGAFMSMEVIGIQSSLLYVDFHSDYDHPTRITFDRGYPSTPKEREEWEAVHRADMSMWPVNPGGAFREDGLYRAVRTDSGSRSLQVQPFKAGDVATTDNVRLLSASATGDYLNGRVRWLWEASAPVPSATNPSKHVEGTEYVSPAGAVCPRSGRWVVRFMTYDRKYNYDLTQIVTMQQGKSMPAIQGDPGHGEWEWVGA